MLKDWIRKLFDPRGPAADILSTDSFYKDRAGLPFSVGHRQRAEMPSIAASEVAKACAPARYASKWEIDVPYSRERVVSPYIVERYKAVMEGMAIVGWWVTQEPRSQFCVCLHARWSKDGGESVHTQCGRRRAPLTDAEVVEKAMTVQMQPSDGFYNQYAISIPGKDTAVLDGHKVMGGTWVQSRRHHRQLTKDMVFWDKGTPREIEKAQKAEASKRSTQLARNIERKAQRLISDRPGDL